MTAVSLYVLSLVRRMFDALARAEAANLAKRRFVSMVSHELRTPLNAISGMADLLRDTQLNREQADMLQTLRGSSRVMLGLIEDVLDFSKIEAGKVVLERTDFDLHALVNSTCRIVAAQAAAKGVEFVVSIMPEVPPAVRGDPHHLRQVLINLAGNAVKFTDARQRHGARLGAGRDRGERAAQVLDPRHRHRHRARGAVEDLRQLHPGRPVHHAALRRQRPGHHHRQAAGAADGRAHRPGERDRPGQHVLGRDRPREAARAGRGRERRPGGRAHPAGRLPAAGARGDGGGARRLGRGAPAAVASVEDGVARLVAEISLAKPYHSALLYASGEDLQLAQRFRRAAPNPAPPTVLAVPRDADVRRFEVLSSGFASVLELPFDKRRLFNVLHSVAAGEEVHEGVVRLQDYARRGAAAVKLRVLVADDNPTNREVVGKILERSGHSVTLVNDGEQTLDAIERDAHDLVILDRNMPGMGGMRGAAGAAADDARARAPAGDHAFGRRHAGGEARSARGRAPTRSCPSRSRRMRLLDEIQRLAGAEGRAGASAGAADRRCRERRRGGAGGGQRRDARTPRGARLFARLRREADPRVPRRQRARSSSASRRCSPARDYHEFRSLVHAMKGSSASMGTDRLTRTCSSLGSLSDAELRLQAPALLRTLSEELGAARSQLERYLLERRKSAG